MPCISPSSNEDSNSDESDTDVREQASFTAFREGGLVQLTIGKTGRGAGVGVGDQWVKPGDWEIGDYVTELCFDYKLDQNG